MLAKKISISKIQYKCTELSSLLRALSHPQRLMILGHLAKGEKTVSDLQELCNISQSQLSQFLTRMKLEGLVKCRRSGRFQYYAASDQRIVKLIQTMQMLFC